VVHHPNPIDTTLQVDSCWFARTAASDANTSLLLKWEGKGSRSSPIPLSQAANSISDQKSESYLIYGGDLKQRS
jgi:hypothetical protein